MTSLLLIYGLVVHPILFFYAIMRFIESPNQERVLLWIVRNTGNFAHCVIDLTLILIFFGPLILPLTLLHYGY